MFVINCIIISESQWLIFWEGESTDSKAKFKCSETWYFINSSSILGLSERERKRERSECIKIYWKIQIKGLRYSPAQRCLQRSFPGKTGLWWVQVVRFPNWHKNSCLKGVAMKNTRETNANTSLAIWAPSHKHFKHFPCRIKGWDA